MVLVVVVVNRVVHLPVMKVPVHPSEADSMGFDHVLVHTPFWSLLPHTVMKLKVIVLYIIDVKNLLIDFL